VTEPSGNGRTDVPGARPLRTEPRPYFVHVAVDALVAFCTVAFLMWLYGVELWAMILTAWVLGFAAAPFTRRWEQRQLEERKAASP
jgi:membrane protein implicated in regulation of membrane protease activity